MAKNEKQETLPVPASPFERSVVKGAAVSDFKAVKRLTKDVVTITRMGEAIVQVQSDLYMIEINDKDAPSGKRNIPAVDVLDCLRGEEYILICGAVLYSTFKQLNGLLRGSYFAIRSGEIPPGKRYRKVDIVALERAE